MSSNNLETKIQEVLTSWEAELAALREKYGPDGWDGTPAPIAVLGQAKRDVEDALTDSDADV